MYKIDGMSWFDIQITRAYTLQINKKADIEYSSKSILLIIANNATYNIISTNLTWVLKILTVSVLYNSSYRHLTVSLSLPVSFTNLRPSIYAYTRVLEPHMQQQKVMCWMKWNEMKWMAMDKKKKKDEQTNT